MPQPLHRRSFLFRAASGGLALGALRAPAFAARRGANEKVLVAVMGTNGRGSDLARGFARQEGCEVAVISDVDERAAAKGVAEAAKVQGTSPRIERDFRKALDDGSIDALVIAAPDHWHAPAGILACAAGKHVYVEKPCSHNAREGEILVEAARKHRRAVQMGNQRRSWPKIMEAIERVKSGVVGRVYYSRGWYSNTRPSIGHGKRMDAPAWLDFDLWQGPAPRRPFADNIVHYNWHWFWNWGTGEIGNNGVHAIDLCRWGLGVDYPIRVSSGGGKYRHEDDQETPDTHVVTFDFDGRRSITWEGLSSSPHGLEGEGFGVSFHGEAGTVLLSSAGYRLLDLKDKVIEDVSGSGSDDGHIANFLAAAGEKGRLNSEIEEGHKSTLLCHLGNIAHRTRRALLLDGKNGRILGDPEAAALWGREYAKDWEVKA
ncbi:MAG TPA: Gfo/Idh/MocA family oxidoreductase [Planctomycetota bacterium]|nr:Gfo/Idh/MocA family oxidoreductase [Planctomycetota bacterium]